MVKSTLSVSWPKRDSIYSVLRHLGPFACIITVLCSENPISSKTRLEVIFQLSISTGHPVQFLGGFAIFQRPWHTQGLWKIAKKPNPVVKFGCGSVRKFAYFFQKTEFKFSKNREKYKKIVKIPKKLNMKLVLCIVWYIFFSDFIVDVLIFKKIFFWILPNSKKVRGTLAPTEYGSTVKNLTLTFCPQIFSWLPFMYRNSPRKFGRKTQC